jgi:hypothetical protein
MYPIKCLVFAFAFLCMTACSLGGGESFHKATPNSLPGLTNSSSDTGLPIVFVSTASPTNPLASSPQFPTYLISGSPSAPTPTTPTSPSQIPNLSAYGGLTGQIYCIYQNGTQLPGISTFLPSGGNTDVWISSPFTISYDGTSTNTTYFQTLDAPFPYNNCAWIITQYKDNNGVVYTNNSSTPSAQSPYVIFSFTNNGVTDGAPILNSSVGPYQTLTSTLNSSNTVVIAPAVENLYQNSAGPSVLMAYIFTNSASQSYLGQIVSSVPQPTLNALSSTSMQNGSSYVYEITSTGGTNIALSSLPTVYTSTSVSGVTTNCAFYRTSDLASQGLINQNSDGSYSIAAAFNPTNLPKNIVNLATSATGPIPVKPISCSDILSDLMPANGLWYIPPGGASSSATASSAGISFVIYNTIQQGISGSTNSGTTTNGASSVSIYNL